MKGFGAGYGAVFFEVAFVTDDDNRDGGVVFDANDLVSEFIEVREGSQGGYAKDEKETVARFYVEFPLTNGIRFWSE